MGRVPEYAHLTWDVDAILDRFGKSPFGIMKRALECGLPVPPRHTISQWRYRKTLSTNALAFFFVLGHMSDPKVDMMRFVRFSGDPIQDGFFGDGEGPEDADELARLDDLDSISADELAALEALEELKGARK